MGREDEGTGPLGWRTQGSFFVVPGSPKRVLWEMLWEMPLSVRSSSHTVPGGSFEAYMHSHPLRAYDFLVSLRKSHFHCGSGTFDFLVVLVCPKRNQEVLKICNGKCNGINLACNGKINV